METCKLYVRRKFPNIGYDDAQPKLPFILGLTFQWLVRDIEEGVSRKWGFWMFRGEIHDENCLSPDAVGRDPKIFMTILFPYLLKDNPTTLPGWSSFLTNCWEVARNTNKAGETSRLVIPIANSWCEE